MKISLRSLCCTVRPPTSFCAVVEFEVKMHDASGRIPHRQIIGNLQRVPDQVCTSASTKVISSSVSMAQMAAGGFSRALGSLKWQSLPSSCLKQCRTPAKFLSTSASRFSPSSTGSCSRIPESAKQVTEKYSFISALQRDTEFQTYKRSQPVSRQRFHPQSSYSRAEETCLFTRIETNSGR